MEVSPVRKMRWMWNGNKERGVVLERVREWEEGRWCCGGSMAQLSSVRKNDVGCIERCLRVEQVLLEGKTFFLLAGIIIVQLQ